MGNCTSSSKGGGSSTSSGAVSALDIVREESRQFAEAKQKAFKRGAYKLEYTDMSGETITRYNAGAGRYVSQRQLMYEKMFPEKAKTTYKAEFKKPNDWGIISENKKTGEITVRKKK